MVSLINDENKVEKEELLEIGDCTEITLNFSSERIDISVSKDDKFRIVEISNRILQDSESFSVRKNGKSIEISKGKSILREGFFKCVTLSKKIEIFIPESYKGDLEIRSSAGNVYINDDLKLNNIKCNQSSGSFKCEKNIEVNKASISVTAGRITLSELVAGEYDLRTSSGGIRIASLSGSGNLESSAGSIDVCYKDIKEYTNLKTSSGHIKMFVPKGLSFEFLGNCTSGTIKSGFDINYKTPRGNKATVKVGDGPYKKITASAMAGMIHLNEK